jgi:hypothetical protein
MLLTMGTCSALEAKAQAQDLSGRWNGSWASCRTSHNGTLHGNFCRVDATHYRVVFGGTFFKVFPFRYAVVLSVISEQPGQVVLAGSSDLGRMFGTFHYRAVVTGNCFVADYVSCKDHGQFRLERQCCH